MVNSPASDETTHLIVEIQLCVNKHDSIRPTTLLYSELLEVIGTYISLCLIHICRLHSFRDISEKLEVIDTYYPWYRGAVVWTKNISQSVYTPIWVKYSLRWIMKMLTLSQSMTQDVKPKA